MATTKAPAGAACDRRDVRPERRQAPGWRRAMYLAEAGAAGRSVRGEPFLVGDGGMAGFLDGRRHLGSVEARAGDVTAWVLLDVPLRPGEDRPLPPLWLATGDPASLYGEYAARWGADSGARASSPVVAGWCSWYGYRTAITPALVRSNLAVAAERGLGVVQVDDGWQPEIGDWRLGPARAEVVGEIAATGVTPGLWTAPFLALDTTHPAVLDHPAAGGFTMLGDDLTSLTDDQWDVARRVWETADASDGLLDPLAQRRAGS